MALLVTTLSLFAGALVAQAQAQTETLSGQTTTISGRVSNPCPAPSNPSVSASFSAVGSATGSYAGQFTNTNAWASVSGILLKPGYIQLRFGIPFTITSGATTITGTITNPYPWIGGLFECGTVYGGSSRATYTATIHPAGQTISGAAQVILSIPIKTGAPGTITETLALP
jgi:hypothetical protein